MYIDVIPIRKLPRAFDAFTYQVPEYAIVDPAKLVGRFVRIPFHRHIEHGIIWAIREKPPSSVKQVLSIESFVETPPLNVFQRRIAEYMAHRYVVSLPLILSTIIPEIPKRLAIDSESSSLHITPSIRITKARQTEVVRLVKESLQSTAQKQYIPLTTLEELIAFATGTIKTLSKGSHLIVVPTVAAAEAMGAVLRQTLQAHRIIIVHSDLAKTVLWKRWSETSSGQQFVYISTKVGIFSGFPSLNTIFFAQETDPAHRQSDQNPRYDARDIVEELAVIHSSRLIYLDAIPSLRVYSNPEITQLKSGDVSQRRERINLQEERTLKRFGPLAESVEERIANESGKILLFLNQRGTRRNLHCTDCGWQHSCQTCHIPLVQHPKGPAQCHSCGARYEIPLACPRCHNTNLRLHGYGTARLEEYVKAKYPEKTVYRYDSDQEAPFQNDADIIIATERILQLAFLPIFSSIVFVNIDGQLNIPDYTSAERAFAMIERIAASSPPAYCALQSYQIDHPLCTAFYKRNISLLFDQELRFRAALRLPPYTTLVTLRCRNISHEELSRDVEQTMQLLQNALQSNSDFTIEGPITPVPEVERGQYRKFIRLHVLNKGADFATIRATLINLPSHWIFDIDHASIRNDH